MKTTSPFPNQFPNWKPVCPVTRTMLDALQLSANPADRLNSGYYTLQRHLALQDYFKMVKEAQEANDYEIMEEAREAMFGSLEVLRNDYQADLRLLIEMQLTLADVWITPPIVLPVS